MLHQPLKLVLLLVIQRRATFAGIPVNEAAAFLYSSQFGITAIFHSCAKRNTSLISLTVFLNFEAEFWEAKKRKNYLIYKEKKLPMFAH